MNFGLIYKNFDKFWYIHLVLKFFVWVANVTVVFGVYVGLKIFHFGVSAIILDA